MSISCFNGKFSGKKRSKNHWHENGLNGEIQEQQSSRKSLALLERLLHIVNLHGRLPVLVPVNLKLFLLLISHIRMLLFVAILFSRLDPLAPNFSLTGANFALELARVLGGDGCHRLQFDEFHTVVKQLVGGDSGGVNFGGRARHDVGRLKSFRKNLNGEPKWYGFTRPRHREVWHFPGIYLRAAFQK